MPRVLKKKIIYFLICLFSLSSAVQAQIQDAALQATLQESFKLALQQSATVAIYKNQIDQTDEQIKQARAAYLPVLSLQASVFEQQLQSTNQLTNNSSSVSQSVSQSTSNINLSQNIFHGFRDLNTVKQRNHLKTGSEWAEKQATEQLYKDVAQAFYSILIFQSDILLYKEQIESTRQRKSELTAARKSRRARDSDILISESVIANLVTAVSKAEAQLIIYQETFSFLTGLTNDVKLVNTVHLPKEFKTQNKKNDMDIWLENFEQRPDIQKSKIDLLAAEDGISAAQAGFYPSLNLSANYYLSRQSKIFGEMIKGSEWDVGLVLNFPFFSGGLTKAQVSEARLIHQTKELNLRLTKQIANQNLKTLIQTVQSDFDQLAEFTNLSDLSHRSYKLIYRDNHLGVATNSDVLTALQTWQESKRNFERIRITAIYDYVRLLIESGQINLDNQINGQFDYRLQNQKKSKHSFWSEK